MRLTDENLLMIGRFKMQVKKLGIRIESARMADNRYALACIKRVESETSNLELLAACKRLKGIYDKPKNINQYSNSLLGYLTIKTLAFINY